MIIKFMTNDQDESESMINEDKQVIHSAIGQFNSYSDGF
ncbi:hypothetical protein VIRA109638_05920 [Vibrio rarus]